MRFNFVLSLLATSPFLAQSENQVTNLRTNEVSRDLSRTKAIIGFDEKLLKCTGAVCGVFGDPHVMTCDGMSYDCQAVGLFNLMDNHMFKIQGHFAGVRDSERIGHLRHVGGSLLNDAMIEFKSDENIPTLQLGFGDVSEAIDTPPSQVGCTMKKYWNPRKKYRNMCKDMDTYGDDNPLIDADCTTTGALHGDNSVYACRKRCEETPGCAKFNYWADEKCELYKDSAKLVKQPGSWNTNLAGTIDSECGKVHPLPELKTEVERLKHGMIGGNCPLLMYLDGELQDISRFNELNKGYLYGDQSSDFSVYMHGNGVRVQYKIPGKEDYAAINFGRGGAGPGEKWNCHWFLQTCLPAVDEKKFKEDSRNGLSTGLMGTPDDNKDNDWMDTDGNTILIEYPDRRHDKYQYEYDYCYDNHCVKQEDSIMAYPGDWTYDDVKCEHLPFIVIDINDPETCDVSADVANAACEDKPDDFLRRACELDCCVGGCSETPQVIDENFTKLGEDPTQTPIELVPQHNDCRTDPETFEDTGDSVCPDSEESIVKILHSEGTDDLDGQPEANDIIYGLETNITPDERSKGKTVRFRVNNPFLSKSNIYIKHDVNVGRGFMDAYCEPMMETKGGCDDSAPLIEVGCFDRDSFSFALVTVYFSSAGFPETNAKVDKCCHADEENAPRDENVVKYTFEIFCDCPNGAIA